MCTVFYKINLGTANRIAKGKMGNSGASYFTEQQLLMEYV